MMQSWFFGYFFLKKTVAMQIREFMKQIAKLLAKYHAIAREKFRKMPGMAADNKIEGSRGYEDKP